MIRFHGVQDTKTNMCVKHVLLLVTAEVYKQISMWHKHHKRINIATVQNVTLHLLFGRHFSLHLHTS
jgi:hypothetical protein